MPSFIATYAGPSGQPRNLTIKAGDLADARKKLRRRGIRATNLRAATSDRKKGSEDASKTEGKGLLSINLNTAFEQAPGVKDKAVFASNKLSSVIGHPQFFASFREEFYGFSTRLAKRKNYDKYHAAAIAPAP